MESGQVKTHIATAPSKDQPKRAVKPDHTVGCHAGQIWRLDLQMNMRVFEQIKTNGLGVSCRSRRYQCYHWVLIEGLMKTCANPGRTVIDLRTVEPLTSCLNNSSTTSYSYISIWESIAQFTYLDDFYWSPSQAKSH